MASFNEKDGILYAEDVSLEDIANEYGTPCYVYSAAAIRHQYERLQNAMLKELPSDRQPLFCYACKANSNLAVLSYLRSLGCGLEIVSEGELHRGIKAGFSADKIVSTGVGKMESEITEGLNAGILQFNIESIPELIKINEVAKKTNKVADIVFRLNPEVSGGGHDKISTGRARDKFGISEERVYEAFELAKTMDNVNACGLSMHIGSQVFTVESFRDAFEKLPSIVENLRKLGHEISRLDIGGGFPIVYQDESFLDLEAYARWVNEIIVPLDTKIIMEPGRFLVGNGGVLLSKVLYIKETNERDFLVIDAAMNDLIRPTLYEAYHGITPVTKRQNKKLYDVVGPICETGDTFTKQRELPELEQDDLVAINSAGAYGFCMSSNYNTRPQLPEVLVDKDQVDLIRRRQTYEDIFEYETVPERFKA
jgi:diaminopimelate decarboxylase